MAATVSLDSGRVELLAGRPDRAEAELRADYDVLSAIGERYTRSTIAGLLADAVLRQGRVDEAIALSVESEEATADDDVESQSLWRRVRAIALVERGETDAALRLAEEAYQLVAETDAPLLRGGTLVDLATVRAAAGRLDDAAAAGRQALELFDAKGDEVDAGTTRPCSSASPPSIRHATARSPPRVDVSARVWPAWLDRDHRSFAGCIGPALSS